MAVLLCISLLALGGTLVYNRLIADKPGTVLVPDNLITPDDAATAPEGTTLPDGNSETKKKTEAGGTGSTVGSSGVTQINAADALRRLSSSTADIRRKTFRLRL